MTAEGTTERVLRLLALLQRRPAWTGAELAAELRVTARSVRRDVERLRSLGYPVHATGGVGGGYQLGAGTRLPPLLLDDEEAIATAVSLRLASAGPIAGAGEAALRALAKLDQVMPPRLREEVRAVHGATETLAGPGAEIDAEVLVTLARACRDAVRVRFSYTGRPEQRTVEPVRLVTTGRRWYLAAVQWAWKLEHWRLSFAWRKCFSPILLVSETEWRDDKVGLLYSLRSTSSLTYYSSERHSTPREIRATSGV
ncbi:hypothetical protein GCM10020218_057720 [Dactylosporangium vinaceum]